MLSFRLIAFYAYLFCSIFCLFRLKAILLSAKFYRSKGFPSLGLRSAKIKLFYCYEDNFWSDSASLGN